jgi:isopentenyl-diphosphate delta-isomerase
MSNQQFEKRKQDHIRLALDEKSQWEHRPLLNRVQLIPDSLPEIDFQDVQIKTQNLNHQWGSPIFIASMTAGHADSARINQILSEAASAKSWLMGVGSQRKELQDLSAANEWKVIRKSNPKVKWAANLGLSQLIQTPIETTQKLIDNLEAVAFFIHLNPLQECLQPEGTPYFKNGLKTIESLSQKIKIPIIIKEVGCGISQYTALRLRELGIYAIDVSGAGGTHWGRIETYRSEPRDLLHQVGLQFKDWGLDTVETLLALDEMGLPFQLWASGGVRSGVDVAKLLAMNAQMVGVAQPFMKAALKGEKELIQLMEQYELELKIAMFCAGLAKIEDFKLRKVWQWNKR